ncbi:GNAT family N-acetyltransferase [Pseudomonas sp. BJa5]|uniref:GNAT family N-acetyltransferase n=1 Tax=Pseudomonas sp. BJa5 TaxID=2936270 RepID=UPI002559E197|nr:GNAT family N-acetyltransferase [Pseudomonas sp. BGr12]MDL2424370.1 GNAT family N-acetyltransferase [Pseudomonas sp. BGr12]
MQPVKTIRPARLEEAACITALVNQAYSHYVARIGQKPAPMLDDYRQVLAESQVYVLTCDAEIAGVLVMRPIDGELLLENVAVLPRYKGQGIGKRLMLFCEEHARHCRCRAICLYTHERMTENIALYTRLGYLETHRATQNGFARVFMRKTLETRL